MDGSDNHWKSAAHIISLISAPDGPINCELCRFGERRCDACLLLYELISLSNIYWRAKNNIWSHASYANARAAKTSILKNSQNHLLPLLPCDVGTKRKSDAPNVRARFVSCVSRALFRCLLKARWKWNPAGQSQNPKHSVARKIKWDDSLPHENPGVHADHEPPTSLSEMQSSRLNDGRTWPWSQLVTT